MSQERYSDLTIRPMVPTLPQDIEALAKLEQRCQQGGSGYSFVYPTEPPRFQKYKNCFILLAETRPDGKVVASVGAAIRPVSFYPNSKTFVKVAMIHTLRVLPEYRGRFIAVRICRDLERRLRQEFCVQFVYAITATSNIASQRIFISKMKYKEIFKAPSRGINLSLVRNWLHARNPEYLFVKFQYPYSETWLKLNFASKFLFPDITSCPVNSTVYTVQHGHSRISAVLANSVDAPTFIAVPLWETLRRMAYSFFNFLLPTYFEKPVGLNIPVKFLKLFPFLIEHLSSSDLVEMFDQLVLGIARDLSPEVADVLYLPLEGIVSGFEDNGAVLLEKSRFISPMLFRPHVTLFMAKSLLENCSDATAMEKHACGQSFWFIDNKELK